MTESDLGQVLDSVRERLNAEVLREPGGGLLIDEFEHFAFKKHALQSPEADIASMVERLTAESKSAIEHCSGTRPIVIRQMKLNEFGTFVVRWSHRKEVRKDI